MALLAHRLPLCGQQARIADTAVPDDEMMPRIEAMLRAYLARRRPEEGFHTFTNRQSVTVDQFAAT